MQFTKYDLGQLDKGRVVEIILKGNAANVRLMDSSNFNNYRNGRNHRYIGGLAKKSPVRLQTTHSAHWYVFISHASEDKDEVVRPLANALKNLGIKVWYDEFEMRIGDSLRRKIDKGLANSRFGIVVVSRDFIKKGWTNYELDGIITKAVSGEQIILPIWHNITKKEVIDYSPSLADKLARNTAIDTVEDIAKEIADVIKTNR